MSDTTQAFEKFQKELAENTEMQESLKRSAQNVTSEEEVHQLFLEHAKSAGYPVTQEDIAVFLEKAKQLIENSEISDEALEEVSGGFLLTGSAAAGLAIAGLMTAGSVAGGFAWAIIDQNT